ncbi:GNAT family N-acetyltransferase [Streptomyces sp. NPDC049936]|uniref:GNAT family N-acetyltransferase n=1 Tax=Streptomyces sp. NPDC049936 TaxID=3365599 RepID=UPI0037A7D38C
MPVKSRRYVTGPSPATPRLVLGIREAAQRRRKGHRGHPAHPYAAFTTSSATRVRRGVRGRTAIFAPRSPTATAANSRCRCGWAAGRLTWFVLARCRMELSAMLPRPVPVLRPALGEDVVVLQELARLVAGGDLVGLLIAEGSTVDLLMIDADRRRQGLGRLLPAQAERLLFAEYREIRLEPFAGDVTAVAFYEACGWSVSGQRRHCVRMRQGGVSGGGRSPRSRRRHTGRRPRWRSGR